MEAANEPSFASAGEAKLRPDPTAISFCSASPNALSESQPGRASYLPLLMLPSAEPHLLLDTLFGNGTHSPVLPEFLEAVKEDSSLERLQHRYLDIWFCTRRFLSEFDLTIPHFGWTIGVARP